MCLCSSLLLRKFGCCPTPGLHIHLYFLAVIVLSKVRLNYPHQTQCFHILISFNKVIITLIRKTFDEINTI